MDYERIHKVQMGVISPSKLRMKLLGAHNSRRKEGGSNSSRASPSKLEDMRNAKNSLLSPDHDGEGASELHAIKDSDASQLDFSGKDFSACEQTNQTHGSTKDFTSKEKGNINHHRNYQNISKGGSCQLQPSGNLSTVHPMKSQEDGNDYDSGNDNASTCSFEFHRGERTSQHAMTGPFTRHVPSKWNDAEKWIVNRQTIHQNAMKKASHIQGYRQMIPNWATIAPESMSTEPRIYGSQAADTKRMDSTNPTSQIVVEKFSFTPHFLQPNLVPDDVMNVLPQLHDEQNHKEVSLSETTIAETEVIPSVESVSMRDVGTEMTPIPSQEPSRTGTPLGATTPSRSPMSSLPSTPKRGGPAPTPLDAGTDDETESRKKGGKTELSEKEIRLKTRREIAALGMQLGKMSIASWASKDNGEPSSLSLKTLDVDLLVRKEYEARAAAWEEAETSRHIARYKREEIKIQAWESHQKAKFEAQMKKVEVQMERMVARAHEKMVEKLNVTRKRAEEKQAAAEAKRSRTAALTADQMIQIRQTGRVPSSSHYRCLSWFL